MDSPENERVPSLDELSSTIPVLSEYCRKLDDNVKSKILKRKIAEVGMDQVTIPDEQFNSDYLPPIEATDLLIYLVLETSFYTKQQFKAYKSLEAYNFYGARIHYCSIVCYDWALGPLHAGSMQARLPSLL